MGGPTSPDNIYLILLYNINIKILPCMFLQCPLEFRTPYKNISYKNPVTVKLKGIEYT